MEMKKIPDPPQSIFSSEVIANKSKEPEIVLHHIWEEAFRFEKPATDF